MFFTSHFYSIHPTLVHFPIALLFVGVIGFWIGSLLRSQTAITVARWSILLGTLGAALAVLSGLLAEQFVPHAQGAHQTLLLHKYVGIAVAIYFSILILMSWKKSAQPQYDKAKLFLLLSSVGLLILLGGAYLGGKLVYQYGVAVEMREERITQQSPTPEEGAHRHDHKHTH